MYKSLSGIEMKMNIVEATGIIREISTIFLNPTIEEQFNSFELSGEVEIRHLIDRSLLSLIKEFHGILYARISGVIDRTIDINWDQEMYKDLLEDIKDESIIFLAITLNKKKLINDILSIDLETKFNIIFFVFGNKFIEWLINTNFNDIEAILSPSIHNVILLSDMDVNIKNEYISIMGANYLSGIKYWFQNQQEADKRNKYEIEMRNMHCNWVNGTKYLTPAFFYFPSNKDSMDIVALKSSVDFLFVKLLVPFLANNTSEQEGVIKSVLCGYKQITISIDKFYQPSNIDCFWDLYNWIYESHTADKMGLLHNICSLYLPKDAWPSSVEELDNNILEIFNAVKSNYNIYLKQNVQLYFEERKKVEDFIFKKLSDISQDISSVLGLIIKNILTTIAVLFGALISYIGNGNRPIVIGAILAFVIFILLNTIYYGAYSYISVEQSKKQYDHFIGYMKGRFTEFELSSLTGTFVEDKIKMFYWFWWITVSLSSLLLLGGLLMYLYVDKILKLFPLVIK